MVYFRCLLDNSGQILTSATDNNIQNVHLRSCTLDMIPEITLFGCALHRLISFTFIALCIPSNENLVFSYPQILLTPNTKYDISWFIVYNFSKHVPTPSLVPLSDPSVYRAGKQFDDLHRINEHFIG